jgi:hypothetical protein
VKIAFRFDSVDHLRNGHPGWCVDDFEVTSPSTATETRYQTAFANAVDWSLTGLWHADATPATVPGGPARSDNSLNYNNGTNYRTGRRRNRGTATSPAVSVSGTSASLTFWCNYQTEMTGTTRDQRWVRILRAADGSVASRHQLSGDAGGCAAMGTWHTHTIAIDPALGSVKVAFHFDTINKE